MGNAGGNVAGSNARKAKCVREPIALPPRSGGNEADSSASNMAKREGLVPLPPYMPDGEAGQDASRAPQAGQTPHQKSAEPVVSNTSNGSRSVDAKRRNEAVGTRREAPRESDVAELEATPEAGLKEQTSQLSGKTASSGKKQETQIPRNAAQYTPSREERVAGRETAPEQQAPLVDIDVDLSDMFDDL